MSGLSSCGYLSTVFSSIRPRKQLKLEARNLVFLDSAKNGPFSKPLAFVSKIPPLPPSLWSREATPPSISVSGTHNFQSQYSQNREVNNFTFRYDDVLDD
jgi:hypothetical protein